MRPSASKISAILLCLTLAFGTMALAGCGGGSNEGGSNEGGSAGTAQTAPDEQDNCYGDDLPAINE